MRCTLQVHLQVVFCLQAEIHFKHLVVDGFGLRGFGQDHAQRILEAGAVGPADQAQGLRGIDRLGG